MLRFLGLLSSSLLLFLMLHELFLQLFQLQEPHHELILLLLLHQVMLLPLYLILILVKLVVLLPHLISSQLNLSLLVKLYEDLNHLKLFEHLLLFYLDGLLILEFSLIHYLLLERSQPLLLQLLFFLLQYVVLEYMLFLLLLLS